jgi:long-subunit fatty acid transport protein
MPAVTTHTSLIITRFNLALGKMFDLGTEYRVLAQREADDQRAGWLAELMWKPSKYIRLGAGYNFTDFSDNEFSNNNYSVRGWFIRLQGKY